MKYNLYILFVLKNCYNVFQNINPLMADKKYHIYSFMKFLSKLLNIPQLEYMTEYNFNADSFLKNVEQDNKLPPSSKYLIIISFNAIFYRCNKIQVSSDVSIGRSIMGLPYIDRNTKMMYWDRISDVHNPSKKFMPIEELKRVSEIYDKIDALANTVENMNGKISPLEIITLGQKMVICILDYLLSESIKSRETIAKMDQSTPDYSTINIRLSR